MFQTLLQGDRKSWILFSRSLASGRHVQKDEYRQKGYMSDGHQVYREQSLSFIQQNLLSIYPVLGAEYLAINKKGGLALTGLTL